jgi:hypothetical protein
VSLQGRSDLVCRLERLIDGLLLRSVVHMVSIPGAALSNCQDLWTEIVQPASGSAFSGGSFDELAAVTLDTVEDQVDGEVEAIVAGS